MSNQVIAIGRACAGATSAANRILWTQDLSDQIGGFQTSQGIYARPIPVPWGGTRFVPEDTFGRRYGSIGPVTDDGVYFQRLRDLHCVDPLTGKTLWTRKNVGLGNQLFGDEELLFVAPAGDETRLVLRAATGEKLGVRRVAAIRIANAHARPAVARLGMPMGRSRAMRRVDPWDKGSCGSFICQRQQG